MRETRSNPACPNPACELVGVVGDGNVAKHGFLTVKFGRRRRYRCKACGKTFGRNTGTTYQGIQSPRTLFDRVAELRVEGMSIAAISRVCGRSWNTVFRWLRKATAAAKNFNDRYVRDFDLEEFQADEIRTFCGTKKRPSWIFMTIEVGPRLWVSTVVGRRGYKSTRSLIHDTAERGRWAPFPLIATDGYKYYRSVVQRTFGVGCVYGQVMKSWRKDRITKVETRLVIGNQWRLEDALVESEDSRKLNTSFIERLNLTVRQGSAYLGRRTACHSRSEEHLREQLELQRCHYNFMRPHRSLKFGAVTRTPAMQAGLATKRLSFRDVFLSSRPALGFNMSSIARSGGVVGQFGQLLAA